MAKERCSERVRDKGMWPSFHQCHRNGVVQRDGKWYCKHHDPEAKKKRDAERGAKWDKEWDEKQEAWRRDAAMSRACDGISTDDLERLAPGELAVFFAKETYDGEV